MNSAIRILSSLLGAIVVLAWTTAVQAQDDEQPPYECDNNFGECGTPQQSGGGEVADLGENGVVLFRTGCLPD